MLFCPTCANVLLVEKGSNVRFFCQTCPYIFNLSGKVTRTMPIKHKPVEAVISDEQWNSSPEVDDEPCMPCGNEKAKVTQVVVSSVEKVSLFRCTKCHHIWKKGQAA